jgi:hypothetical protein
MLRLETRSLRRVLREELPSSSIIYGDNGTGSEREIKRSRKSTSRYGSPFQGPGESSRGPAVAVAVASTTIAVTTQSLESPMRTEVTAVLQPPPKITESNAVGPSCSSLIKVEKPRPRNAIEAGAAIGNAAEAPLPRNAVEAPLPQNAVEAPLPQNVVVALLHIGYENPNMGESVISNLELHKAKLQMAFDNARDQASAARSTKTELNS